MTMDVDAALSSLGKFGRWQMIKYSMICMSVTVSGCWHMMVSVFTGDEPEHHCKVPEGQLLNETIPLETVLGVVRNSRCLKYANFSASNATINCDEGWVYENEYETTIVTEWDLVCQKNYLAETSQSVFNFGVMVGAIVFTSMADKIGRKPVHLGCQYAMLLVGVAIAFSPNYITFVVLRFLLGAIREGAGLVGIVMACELFPAAQRTFAGTALELFWAGAWMILTLLAYFVRNWRHLQLCVTLPPALTIALIWLLPESVPWLVANGKIDHAKKILKEGAKFNGVEIPDHIFECSPKHNQVNVASDKVVGSSDKDAIYDVTDAKVATTNDSDSAQVDRDMDEHTDMSLGDKTEHEKTMKPLLENETSTNHQNDTRANDQPVRLSENGSLRRYLCACSKKRIAQRRQGNKDEPAVVKAIQYTCLDLLKSKTMVMYTFVMCSVWFASGVIYFGLSLSTSTMPGGKYINFFLSGAVEAPAYGMTVIVLQKFGRRWPLFIFHMVAALVLFINVWLPNETESGINLVPLIITLTNVGKFAMTAAFGTVVLYAPEIYPTNLRNLGFGMASVWGRIGGMIAPFAVYIGKIVPWIPGLVFSIVAVVTGCGVFFLPETLNRPLPDTIEEIENWKRSGGIKSTIVDSQPKKKYKTPKNWFVRDKNSPKSQNETIL